MAYNKRKAKTTQILWGTIPGEKSSADLLYQGVKLPVWQV